MSVQRYDIRGRPNLLGYEDGRYILHADHAAALAAEYERGVRDCQSILRQLSLIAGSRDGQDELAHAVDAIAALLNRAEPTEESDRCSVCGGTGGYHRDVSPYPYEEVATRDLVPCPKKRAEPTEGE